MITGSATSLMLSVEDYPPGDYNLTIEVLMFLVKMQTYFCHSSYQVSLSTDS